jgi:hypothetical protein
MCGEGRRPECANEDFDLNLQKNRPAHLWKPGQSGNPAGHPPSSRPSRLGKFTASHSLTPQPPLPISIRRVRGPLQPPPFSRS